MSYVYTLRNVYFFFSLFPTFLLKISTISKVKIKKIRRKIKLRIWQKLNAKNISRRLLVVSIFQKNLVIKSPWFEIREVGRCYSF